MSNSNISRKLAQVPAGTLHAGVDLAMEKNVVVIIDENARRCDRFTFPQDIAGYEYFRERLEKVKQRQGATQVVVAMEPTNYFWKLLANWLEKENIVYHLVNSYTVSKHREGDQLDRSKDDPRDGFVIADLSRTGKFTETKLQKGVYAELREYAALYRQTMKNLDREKAILWGLMGQVFPELRLAFSDLIGITASAVLRTCPAAASIRQLSEDEFISKVRSAFGGKKLSVSRLQHAHHLADTSIGVSDGLQAYAQSIRLHLKHIEGLQEEVLEIIEALKNCLMQVPTAKYLLSIKGLSILSVALILAEIGDPARYRNAGQLVKLAGIQPVPNLSGRKQRSSTPMSHQGRPGLRHVLYLAALRLILVDPHFEEVYLYLQNRPKNPLTKMQAVGVLMNKLLQVLWALARKETYYDPFFASSI